MKGIQIIQIFSCQKNNLVPLINFMKNYKRKTHKRKNINKFKIKLPVFNKTLRP